MTTTLDPAKKSTFITLSNGNRTATRTVGTPYYVNVFSTNSGAMYDNLYVEATTAAVADSGIGISTAMIADGDAAGNTGWMGVDTTSIALYGGSLIYYNGANVGTLTAAATNDVFGVVLDRVNKQIRFRNVTQGGAWWPSGDPLGGYPVPWIGTGALYFGFTLSGTDVKIVNFDGAMADTGAMVAGVYRWDGTPMVPVHRTMPAAKGTLTLTRNPNIMVRGRPMLAVKGTLTLSGVSAALSRSIAAVLGTFTLATPAAVLRATRVLTADTRANTLTGFAVGLSKAGALAMIAAKGAFDLAGQAANLVKITYYQLTADAGALNLSGKAVTLTATSARILDAATGALALVGNAVNFVKTGARALVAELGALLLTGNPAALVRGVVDYPKLAAVTGTVTLSGNHAVMWVDRVQATPQPGRLTFGMRSTLRRW